MQVADLSRLLQRGRVRVHAAEQIDQPIRPNGDGQPARNEGVIPDDPVLDRDGRPIEGRIDADENGDEAKDHDGRIEHRFAAARDPARFVCAHTLFSLSVTNPDAPRCRSRDRRSGYPRHRTSLTGPCFGEFGLVRPALTRQTRRLAEQCEFISRQRRRCRPSRMRIWRSAGWGHARTTVRREDRGC